MSSPDPVFFTLGDETFHRRISSNDLNQFVQQCKVLHCSFSLLIMASETRVLYVVFMRLLTQMRHVVQQSLSVSTSKPISRAHEQGSVLPVLFLRRIAKLHWCDSFWLSIKIYERKARAFSTIHIWTIKVLALGILSTRIKQSRAFYWENEWFEIWNH